MSVKECLIVCFIAVTCVQCINQDAIDYIAGNLDVKFQVTNNFYTDTSTLTTLSLKNNGKDKIKKDAWEIYFNMLYMVEPDHDTVDGYEIPGSGLKFFHVEGGLYKFIPTQNFTELEGGQTLVVDVVFEFWIVARTDFMPRWYVVGPGLQPQIIASTTDIESFVGDFTEENQYKRYEYDVYSPPTPEQRHQRNALVDDATTTKHIIPTVYSGTFEDTSVTISSSNWKVNCSDFQTECSFITDYFGVKSVSESSSNDGKIMLLKQDKVFPDDQPNNILAEEAYSLDISEEGVVITASTSAGAFYGIQSIISLAESSVNQAGIWSLPVSTIKDGPRFIHRGMYLDVCRNFHSKQEILTLIRIMAMYKLNVLHIHLSDDEGWRLQINSYPELVNIGSKRSHEAIEEKAVYPQLGSGPYNNTSGSGFYTQDDYIEILQEAAKHHIKVIPEIDLPGHANAAIKANLYTHQNDETDTLISDIDDTTGALSVQYFIDNAVNPCIYGTYEFVETVVGEFVNLHANVQNLTTFHLGGDEISGAWIESPKCKALIDSTDGFPSSVDDLLEYFLRNASTSVFNTNPDLNIALWEDGALRRSTGNPFNKTDVFNQKEIYTNAWQNIWEWGVADRAYLLANAGYKVILSHATHLYFDQPHEADPEERGLYWASRFTDTKKTFSYMPENVYANADVKRSGEPYNETLMCAENACDQLINPENVIGMQGHLWSETVREKEDLDYMIFPRLLALAERAWHKGSWEDDGSSSIDKELFEKDWSEFAMTLGNKELRRLDNLNVSYRLPLPGVMFLTTDVMDVNCKFPGMLVRYRVADEDWQQVPCNSQVKLFKSGTYSLQTLSTDSDTPRFSRISTVAVNIPGGAGMIKGNVLFWVALMFGAIVFSW